MDLIYHNLHLYNHHLQNIAKWKDQRLELVEIPKGFEILQNADFTIEKILDDEPSQIAEKSGIDDYVTQIIFNDTTKKAIISINKSYLEG